MSLGAPTGDSNRSGGREPGRQRFWDAGRRSASGRCTLRPNRRWVCSAMPGESHHGGPEQNHSKGNQPNDSIVEAPARRCFDSRGRGNGGGSQRLTGLSLIFFLFRRRLRRHRLEHHRIMAQRHFNPQRMRPAFRFVILPQPFSQPVRFHPGGGVFGRIEGGRPAQHFHPDLIFFNLLRGPFQIFVAQILQQPRQSGRSDKQSRRENGFQLRPRLPRGGRDLNLKHCL